MSLNYLTKFSIKISLDFEINCIFTIFFSWQTKKINIKKTVVLTNQNFFTKKNWTNVFRTHKKTFYSRDTKIGTTTFAGNTVTKQVSIVCLLIYSFRTVQV